MKTYNFEQIYYYGENWDGQLNVPESAKFYKDCGRSDEPQSWYIFIPKKDFDTIKDLYAKGCIQVRSYQLLDYIILYLKNIKPYGKWSDTGKSEIQRLFKSWFDNTYIYRYATAQYRVEINKDAKDLNDIVQSELINPETLLACYKIKKLATDAEILCTRVNLKHRLGDRRKDDPFIDTITLKLSDIPPQELYDTKEKLVINHDATLYDTSFNETIKKLY